MSNKHPKLRVYETSNVQEQNLRIWISDVSLLKIKEIYEHG